MTTPRDPARPAYDAAVSLLPFPDFSLGGLAHALVKFTFRVDGGRCAPADPVPLFHDINDPDIKPKLVQGTDYWTWKEATDFVVVGSAFPPNGTPVRSMTVSTRVGSTTKRIRVFGKRVVEWAGGEPAWFPPGEPFAEMPLTYDNAYGGIDWRVGPWKPGEIPNYPWENEHDHPGIYPRNPFGKGYTVLPGEVPDTELPNLEDPDDLLTVERLVTGDPKAWFRQPLPWCFDWVHLMTFPRFVYFFPGVDAWFPGPQDAALPEVRRGFTPANYRDLMTGPDAPTPHPNFYQEASLGLVLKHLKAGDPVVLEGMHPAEPVLRFELPVGLKSLEFEIEGKREAAQPRLHNVVCRPAEKLVTMTFAGELPLPRPFIPGVHKHIPVAVRVNGDAPVPYVTSPTMRDREAAGRASMPAPPWEKRT